MSNNPVESTSVTLYEQGFINVYISRRNSTRAHYVTHASHARFTRVQAKIGAGFDLGKWGKPSNYGGPRLPAPAALSVPAEPDHGQGVVSMAAGPKP